MGLGTKVWKEEKPGSLPLCDRLGECILSVVTTSGIGSRGSSSQRENASH